MEQGLIECPTTLVDWSLTIRSDQHHDENPEMKTCCHSFPPLRIRDTDDDARLAVDMATALSADVPRGPDRCRRPTTCYL